MIIAAVLMGLNAVSVSYTECTYTLYCMDKCLNKTFLLSYINNGAHFVNAMPGIYTPGEIAFLTTMV